MRGLTDEERSALRGEVTTNVGVWQSLHARGLCAGCEVSQVTYNGAPSTQYVASITPAGELALRLDAAARAMGGGSG